MLRLYSLVLVIIFVFLQSWPAYADDLNLDNTQYTDIGNGLWLETLPPQYVTIAANQPQPTEPEWVTIPASYETVTERIPVQSSHGGASLEYYDVKKRVVKTPARDMLLIVPIAYSARTVRKQIKPETYIIRNADGLILHGFDDAVELINYLNTR